MDLRDGRNNVPAGPSDTVFIDQNTPTTGGVVFDPNTPALTDTLYVSSTNGSTWIYNGSAYTTYTAPAVQATPFFIAGTDIDAGSNKKAIIERSGEVRVKNSTISKIKTISGTRSLLLSSYVSSKNEILSTGDQLWLGTSDNHPFYLRTNGVERLRALATGEIRFNQAYSFPTTDGTVGQVLKTDGAGVVSFGTAAGGLTYFTEAQNSATPNATVKVDSLTAIASTTNADIAIVPKGTGAFTLAVPDNLVAGGNKRGANSVDLQTSRTANTQVASGQYSFAASVNNTSSGYASASLGTNNTSSGTASLAFGNSNSASANYCLASGYGNISSANAAISLGYANIASGGTSLALGSYNTSSGYASIASGNGANTFSVIGRYSYSSSNISVIGDSQLSKLTLVKRTTNDTPIALSVDNGVASSTNQLVLQNNNSIRFKGTIIARQSGSTNTSAWDIDGIIQRGTSAATTTLLISNVNVVQNTPAWGTPSITANTTLGCLTVTVTGVATTNIQWNCSIETTEVIYA